MTLTRIEQLLSVLPFEVPYLKDPGRGLAHKTTRARDINRSAVASFDPAFGWNYATAWVSAGVEMTDNVQELFLQAAYEFEARGVMNRDIYAALEITHPSRYHQRALLNSYLIIEDLPLDKIVALTGLRMQTVHWYEQLFFNVRDRMNEPAYISHLIYPDTRQEELQDGYWKSVSAEQLILRAAYNFGEDAVKYLIGLKIDFTNESAAAIAKVLEAEFMINARMLTRLGALNQSNMPGLGRASGIIIASKQAGAPTSAGDDTAGVGGITMSLGESIVATLQGIQSDDFIMRREAQAVRKKMDDAIEVESSKVK